MYRIVTSLMPKKVRDNFARLLVYADIKRDSDYYFGFIIIISLLSSILFSLLIKSLFKFSFIISLIVLFSLISFLFYFSILTKADKKAETIERFLPDTLQLMVGNLRAGLTIDRALLLSTRSEFGVLKDEFDLVGKQITLGKSLSSSLLEMTKRVKSRTFEKTILIIVSGLKSGGELVSLLEETSEDLTQKRIVDKKVRTSVNLYVIFVSVAIGFGAPLLFGLSSYLMGILVDTLSKIKVPDETRLNIPFTVSNVPSVTEGFVVGYSIVFLITASIFGSLMIGLITRGKEKYGVRYIPLLLALSLGVFFIIRLVIGNVFSGLFAF